MPTLLSEEIVQMDWADIVQSETNAGEIARRILNQTPRTPGIHLSGVLRHIAFSTGVLKRTIPQIVPSPSPSPSPLPQDVESTPTDTLAGTPTPANRHAAKDGEVDEEMMPLRMAVGMAWERWVAALYPEMEWQPGELEKDGITGSMDGFTVEGYGTVIEEFKATWKSSFHPFLSKKNTMWLWQGMGYAHMMDTRWVRYHVLYVNGDYRLGGCGEPEYRKILVEFSKRELEGNWKRVVLNRDEEGVRAEG